LVLSSAQVELFLWELFFPHPSGPT
jgi:hypothetical protein